MWLIASTFIFGLMGAFGSSTSGHAAAGFLLGPMRGGSCVGVIRRESPLDFSKRAVKTLECAGFLGTLLWLFLAVPLVGPHWPYLAVPGFVYYRLLCFTRLSPVALLAWTALAAFTAWVGATNAAAYAFVAALPVGGVLLRGICRRL